MHDGSVATLEEAIEHYAAGGRTIVDGPNRGLGRDNPNKRFAAVKKHFEPIARSTAADYINRARDAGYDVADGKAKQ